METPQAVQSKIRDNLLKKALNDTEDFYSEGVKQNAKELIDWLLNYK